MEPSYGPQKQMHFSFSPMGNTRDSVLGELTIHFKSCPSEQLTLEEDLSHNRGARLG